MAIEQAKGVENITEGLSGTIGDITKKLKELLYKIMGPINKIMEEFGIKEKVETQQVVDKSKIDLNKLMDDVNSKVEKNGELNEDEEKILKGILDKNKDLKTIFNRMKDEFGEDIKNRESEVFLSKIKEETDGGKIEENEFKKIIKTMKENKEFIEDEGGDKNKSGISFIIKQINEDEEIKKGYSIKEIISAYKILKKKSENGEKTMLDKNSVLIELEKTEK